MDEVVPCYEDTAALERLFADGPGLHRFYGNHDLDWRKPKFVTKWLGDDVSVLEALRLVVVDGDSRLGEFFLVHGHQGTDLSDRGALLSRLVLRRVWRKVQRSQGWLSTTPAENHDLRHKHDQAMFRWARGRVVNAPPDDALALVAGHTHHTVFPGAAAPQRASRDAADLASRLAAERARDADPVTLARLRGSLERIRAVGRRREVPPLANEPPCYFNTGACCFPDRYVTGIELADGEIRLVWWDGEEGQDEPKVLAPALPITDLFARLAAA